MKLHFKYHRRKLKMVSDDLVFFQKIRDAFSVENKTAKYSEYAKDFHNFISPIGVFNAGLVHDVIHIAKKLDPDVEISYDPNVKNMIYPFDSSNVDIEYYENDVFKNRDYQTKSINLALDFGRAIFELPTGVGKSRIIYIISQNLLKASNIEKILILVPNLQLVRQLHQDFIDYGISSNKHQMFSSFNDVLDSSPIIISNRQWLEKHSNDLPKIDAVFIDECHQLKYANKVTKFIQKLDTHVRFGFTGTLPEDPKDVLTIKGIVGPLVYSEKAHTFQSNDNQVLAPLEIVAFKINHSIPQPRPLDYSKTFYEEWQLIESLKNTNKEIAKLTLKFAKCGNTILLFDHTKHGKMLFDLVNKENLKSDLGFDCHFINGEIPVETREEIRALMETSNNVVLVANCKCFGVGINIKNVNNIVLALAGKGQTKIIQSIGRSLRKLKNKKALLVDIYHSYQYSTKHFLKRVALYQLHYKKIISKIYTLNVD